MLNSDALGQLATQLVGKLKSDPRSSSEISRLSGVSQPTVSRFRCGKIARKRHSSSFNKLCNYYELALPIVHSTNKRNNPTISDAIMAVWDGTEAHAQAIARVIRSLKGYRFTNRETPK